VITPPSDSVRLTCCPDVLSRTLDGEAVLLNLASGTYFGLNEVGTRIWELIAAGTTYGALRAAVLDEFDVEAGPLERDLAELIDSLRARGLVVLADAPAAGG
jgi:hypothetical protein